VTSWALCYASSALILVPVGQPSQTLRVSLVMEKSTFVVGEPVDLSIQVENVSEPGNGPVPLNLGCGLGGEHCEMQLHYRHEEESQFRRYESPSQLNPGIEYLVVPDQLAAGETRTVHSTVLFDGPAGRFLLDEPGLYEFRASLSIPGRPVISADSRVVEVHVRPIPDSERDAYLAYDSPRIAEILVSGWYFPEESVREAVTLVERFPESRYSAIVRPKLIQVLEGRVTAGTASEFERLSLQRIESREPVERR